MPPESKARQRKGGEKEKDEQELAPGLHEAALEKREKRKKSWKGGRLKTNVGARRAYTNTAFFGMRSSRRSHSRRAGGGSRQTSGVLQKKAKGETGEDATPRWASEQQESGLCERMVCNGR